jgi:hypothetical protein
MIFKRGKSNDIKKKLQEELDDHLAAINENSSEIAQNGDHLVEMEEKFEKLKEKVDEIHFMLSKLTQNEDYELSENEKRVFMVLYSVEQTPLSYTDIAVRTHQTELAVKAYVFSMINKGIPIVEMKMGDQSFFKLAKEFKDLQAKENVLKIDQEIVKSV